MSAGRRGDNDSLSRMGTTMRRWIIEQSLESNVGHIGSALCIVEIVAALWGHVMREPGSDSLDRDRFILGKGHAALALYCALRWRGQLDEPTFHTYCGNGSLLGAHPEHALPGVDVSTGSLGQGLSIGCGLACGLRVQSSPGQVYVLVSDAECNEGQVWEAAMFAAHHHLSNLTVIVDLNGTQALGHTKHVLDLDPLADKWKAFGWQVVEVDGHDLDALVAALTPPSPRRGPRAIVARTVLGKGVSFMENRVEWHYRNLSPELARQALAELADIRS